MTLAPWCKTFSRGTNNFFLPQWTWHKETCTVLDKWNWESSGVFKIAAAHSAYCKSRGGWWLNGVAQWCGSENMAGVAQLVTSSSFPGGRTIIYKDAQEPIAHKEGKQSLIDIFRQLNPYKTRAIFVLSTETSTGGMLILGIR